MRTIYIVRRTGGGYDDYYETDIVAFTVEDKAKELEGKLNAQLDEYKKRKNELRFHPDWRAPEIPAPRNTKFWFEDEELKKEYGDKYQAHNEKWEELKRSIMTLDPVGDYYDDSYDYISIELIEE